VFLDAECAWYGDPAFDLAFCLNHLLLKCLWNRRAAPGFLACFDSARRDLSAGVALGAGGARGARGGLLAGLLLARIDGKSPVEYITAEADKERVRASSRAACCWPAAARGSRRCAAAWAAELGDERHDHRIAGARPPGLGFARPADRRSRGALAGGASAGRSRRPAPRPARGEAVELRDGGDAARRPRRARRVAASMARSPRR
jgi:hypothetical protein